MKLRNHPLMSYRGLNNWPPVWTWKGGHDNQHHPRGEIGYLRDVFLSRVQPRSRVFLIMEHEGQEFMGGILFTDIQFCGQIYALLKNRCGTSIEEISGLDIGHLT